MRMNKTTLSTLLKLFKYISKKRKIQFFLLIILMVFAAFAEIISVGSVVPFLSVLIKSENISSMRFLSESLAFFHIENSFVVIILLFGAAALFAGLTRLILLFFSTKISFALGAELSLYIYRRILYQPYRYHITTSSSELIKTISTKCDLIIYNILTPLINLISSLIILSLAFISILFVFSKGAFFIFFIASILYLLIAKMVKKSLYHNGKRITKESEYILKCLQESLGGIRDIIIDGTQFFYSEIFSKSDLLIRSAQAKNTFISQSPKYILESLAMIGIAWFSYIQLSGSPNQISSVLPLLGAIALGAQRMLPLFHQVFTGYSNILSSQSALEDIISFLELPIPKNIEESKIHSMHFDKKIVLKNLAFSYNKNQMLLQNINIEIFKGDRVGIIGETGSGKTTLINILMGLLSPTSGSLKVDQVYLKKANLRSWQKNIAHVPQDVYIADLSIEENIAFGLPLQLIDHNKVLNSVKKVHLSEFIQSCPLGLKTVLGERGVSLSGGQKQRIAIARALYKNANVLIFDEATSSLDNRTENYIMNAIESLDKEVTIFLVAHRISTLKNCDYIIELKHGRVIRRINKKEFKNKLNF